MKTTLLTYLFLFVTFKVAVSQISGFTLTGSPTSSNGATWVYQATINSISYDLEGILFVPTGTGTFPAVIINHGTGGSSNGYSKNAAKKIVKWGYVCIGTNYTHSSGVPCGLPGVCTATTDYGSSSANLLRAMKCWDILSKLGYVDTACIAAFGHSRGAFLTTGLAGTYPNKFSCFGHTAGGVGHPTDQSMPSVSVGNNISKPYILHHGTNDNIVDLVFDQKLDTLLTNNSVTHTLNIYQGYDHSQISLDTIMFSKTKTFFAQHICSQINSVDKNFHDKGGINLFPNPTANFLKLEAYENTFIEIRNMVGDLMVAKNCNVSETINLSSLPNGLYLISINLSNTIITKKLIISK